MSNVNIFDTMAKSKLSDIKRRSLRDIILILSETGHYHLENMVVYPSHVELKEHQCYKDFFTKDPRLDLVVEHPESRDRVYIWKGVYWMPSIEIINYLNRFFNTQEYQNEFFMYERHIFGQKVTSLGTYTEHPFNMEELIATWSRS